MGMSVWKSFFNISEVESQSRLKIVRGGDVSGSTHSACGARGGGRGAAGPAGRGARGEGRRGHGRCTAAASAAATDACYALRKRSGATP